jgi:hypothetical protein
LHVGVLLGSADADIKRGFLHGLFQFIG